MSKLLKESFRYSVFSMSDFVQTRRPAFAATWRHGLLAAEKAIPMLKQGVASIDALVLGTNVVERDTADQYFVGVGGYPNDKGVMELDAAIMDDQLRYGAVLGLKNIAIPISVARTVMEDCPHNVLVAEGALEWALNHNFKEENILTPEIAKEYEAWKATQVELKKEDSHDTVGVICLDDQGRLCCGTSTSGWKFKHPGRIGDAPLIGSGLYCDGKVGAAVATGYGEEIMRVCMAFLVVECMRNGMSVQAACSYSIERLLSLRNNKKRELARMYLDQIAVGIVAMDAEGNIGAASTISPTNVHYTEDFFPVVAWRAGVDAEEPQGNTEYVTKAVKILEARPEGVRY